MLQINVLFFGPVQLLGGALWGGRGSWVGAEFSREVAVVVVNLLDQAEADSGTQVMVPASTFSLLGIGQ